MGGTIDTDPASESIAQDVVNADTFYTRAQDGRQQRWSGSVWLSTPSGPDSDGTHGDWFQLAVSKFDSKEIDQAIVNVPSNYSTEWYKKAAKRFAHAQLGHVRFDKPAANQEGTKF